MATIPNDKSLDSSISFLKNGYDFIHQKRAENKSNVITVRLMGLNIVCLGGEEGARLFYDPQKFQRSGAVPKRVQKTLTGENAIHTLDGAKHHQRKEMFMSLMSDKNIESLMDCMKAEWKSLIRQWEQAGEVKLFREVQQLISKAVCVWAGVPLDDAELEQRANDFTAMIDAFGAVGPRHWRGKAARSRTEKWITEVIEQLRKGVLKVAEGTPLAVIGFHKEENGELFDTNMAAIELINILRPTVAISFISLLQPLPCMNIRNGLKSYRKTMLNISTHLCRKSGDFILLLLLWVRWFVKILNGRATSLKRVNLCYSTFTVLTTTGNYGKIPKNFCRSVSIKGRRTITTLFRRVEEMFITGTDARVKE